MPRTGRQKAKSRDKENKKRNARRQAKKQARSAERSDGYRRLTLESGVWKWDAGKSFIVIVSPAGAKKVIDYSTFFDEPWHVLENLQENRGLWVMPSQVREYIEKHLVRS